MTRPPPAHYDLLEILIETEEDPEDDFVQVVGARTYDEDGEEVEAEDAWAAIQNIHTCRDQGVDIEAALRTQVEGALAAADITYTTLHFVEE